MKIGRGTALVAIAYALVALSGCAAEQDAVPSATPGSVTSTPPTQALPVVEKTSNLQVLSWSASDPDFNSDRIEIIVPQGNCVVPVGVSIDESHSSVEITALGERLDEPCTQQDRVLIGYVQLSAPLGDRALKGMDEAGQ